MDGLVLYPTHAQVLPNGSAMLPEVVRHDFALSPGDELQIFRDAHRIILEKMGLGITNVPGVQGMLSPIENPLAAFTEWADPINDGYDALHALRTP